MVFSQRTLKLKNLISTGIGMDDLTSHITTDLITLAIAPRAVKFGLMMHWKVFLSSKKLCNFCVVYLTGTLWGVILLQVLHFWVGFTICYEVPALAWSFRTAIFFLCPLHLFGFTAPNATNLSTLPRNKSNPGVIFSPPKEKRKTTWKNQKSKCGGWILSPTKALGPRALQEWS
jgi:hypothetical protein